MTSAERRLALEHELAPPSFRRPCRQPLRLCPPLPPVVQPACLGRPRCFPLRPGSSVRAPSAGQNLQAISIGCADYGRAIARRASGRALLFASTLDRPNALKGRLEFHAAAPVLRPASARPGKLMILTAGSAVPRCRSPRRGPLTMSTFLRRRRRLPPRTGRLQPRPLRRPQAPAAAHVSRRRFPTRPPGLHPLTPANTRTASRRWLPLRPLAPLAPASPVAPFGASGASAHYNTGLNIDGDVITINGQKKSWSQTYTGREAAGAPGHRPEPRKSCHAPRSTVRRSSVSVRERSDGRGQDRQGRDDAASLPRRGSGSTSAMRRDRRAHAAEHRAAPAGTRKHIKAQVRASLRSGGKLDRRRGHHAPGASASGGPGHRRSRPAARRLVAEAWFAQAPGRDRRTGRGCKDD